MKNLKTLSEIAKQIDEMIAKKGLEPNIISGLQRFDFTVHVVSLDGTTFTCPSAYCFFHGDHLFVVTEHHKTKIFAVDELSNYYMSKNVSIPTVEL